MRSLLFPGAVATFAAVGCAVPPNDAPDAEVSSQSATALVLVERSAGPGEASRESLVARFVRARQGTMDDPALRIAGVVQELPAIGTCSTTVDPDGALQARAIDLLDVGALAVEGPQGRTVMLPRAMPDPAGVVSGVFYSTSRASEAFAPGSPLALRASGGVDLEGFAVQANAPKDLTDVQVAASPLGLEVTWDATDADPRDVVYVDVLAPAPQAIARCTGTDGGHLVLPVSVLGAAEEGLVAVHRVHREPFRAKGVDPGEVRFDLARVVPFRR